MVVEAEICAAAGEALTRLGFTDYVIKLNHRKVLSGVLQSAGVEEEKHESALIALDKLDKIGSDGVAKEFEARGINASAGEMLLTFFSELASLEEVLIDDPDEKNAAVNAAVLGRLVEFVGANETGAQGIDELRMILSSASASGVAKRIKFEPSLARGLSYYTGSIFEIAVPDLAGSLGGGGRYDNLVGMFLGQNVPACGFSLGLERILVVMTEREMFPAASIKAPADLMVTVWNEEAFKDSIAVASELRSQGLRVDLYPEADKLGKQFKYASAREIPVVVIFGDDERARGELAIKDLRSGEQRSVKRTDAAVEIKKMLCGTGVSPV
jgi:histidyl-tRNA synthetase